MDALSMTRLVLAVAMVFVTAACSTVRTEGAGSSQKRAAQENAVRGSEALRRSPADLAVHAREAVVTVIAYRDGEVLQSGTGFFIRKDGVVVTNLHVVAGAERLTVEIADGEIFDAIYVLSTDARRDLILLQLPVINAPVLPVAAQTDIRVGESVYVIGNPLGLRGTFSDGLVSAKRIHDGVTYLQITAPISQGSSGGPVMNQDGKVIGVATSFFTDGQNLNMAIPAWHTSGMLALAGAPTRFEIVAGELKTEEQKRLEARADESQQLLEALPHETRASLGDLGQYEQQVLVRTLFVGALMSNEGWTYLDGLGSSGSLEPDELDGVYVTLGRGRYLATGVCDDDCTDLDLIVMDSAEEVVGVDREVDPEPVVTFDVPYRQDYFVGVKMIECAAMDCVYTIVMFRQD